MTYLYQKYSNPGLRIMYVERNTCHSPFLKGTMNYKSAAVHNTNILRKLYLEKIYINELVQERCNSIANTLELCLSYNNPSIFIIIHNDFHGESDPIMDISPGNPSCHDLHPSLVIQMG